MDKTLTIKKKHRVISLSDFDVDMEVELRTDDDTYTIFTYIDKEDLFSIRNHINYLLSKIE